MKFPSIIIVVIILLLLAGGFYIHSSRQSDIGPATEESHADYEEPSAGGGVIFVDLTPQGFAKSELTIHVADVVSFHNESTTVREIVSDIPINEGEELWHSGAIELGGMAQVLFSGDDRTITFTLDTQPPSTLVVTVKPQ